MSSASGKKLYKVHIKWNKLTWAAQSSCAGAAPNAGAAAPAAEAAGAASSAQEATGSTGSIQSSWTGAATSGLAATTAWKFNRTFKI